MKHHRKIPPHYSFVAVSGKDTLTTSLGTFSRNALLCSACSCTEDGKGDETRIGKEMKRQNLQQTVGDSSVALLAIASPLLIAHIDENVFGDLQWDELIGLNACNDSIDRLVAGV